MTALVVAGTILTTLAGGYTARRVTDHRHLVLGLTAGLMLGVVTFTLIPEALELTHGQHLLGVPTAMLAFLAGFIALHVIEKSTGAHEHHGTPCPSHTNAPGVQLLAPTAMVAHSLLDGVTIAAGFQASGAIGTAVAIAVLAHRFTDGFNVFTVTARVGSRRQALTFLAASALAPVIGIAVGTVTTIPDVPLGLYLGFFGGFLLYLATADILPEAHHAHPSRLTFLSTVSGAGIIWALVSLAPHAH